MYAVRVEQVPAAFGLNQNYPNPFNPTTKIEFDLPVTARVTLEIYNALGQAAAKLIDHEIMDDGRREIEFNASGLSSGVYFYRIVAERISNDKSTTSADRFMSTKKMILVK